MARANQMLAHAHVCICVMHSVRFQYSNEPCLEQRLTYNINETLFFYRMRMFTHADDKLITITLNQKYLFCNACIFTQCQYKLANAITDFDIIFAHT